MNTYEYDENFQAEDTWSGMNTAQAKKAPNIFKQLIYSVMPGKYGELANVKVKGFIFYYLFWCFIMCSVASIAMLTISIVKEFEERLANGYVLVYEKLPIVILLLIGISIFISIIMTIFASVIFAISYCIEGLPTALIVMAISKKKRSLFDLYKAAVYSQTPVNIAMLCTLVSLELFDDLSWLSLPIGIARIASLIILIFGVLKLPEKPLIPGNKKTATESSQYRPEGSQYGQESNQYRSESSQYSAERNRYETERINQVSSTPSKPRVTPGYWTCTCGRQNPSYTGTCTCGKSKY